MLIVDDVPRRTSLTWTDLSGPEALSVIVLEAGKEREMTGGRDEDAATWVVTVRTLSWRLPSQIRKASKNSR